MSPLHRPAAALLAALALPLVAGTAPASAQSEPIGVSADGRTWSAHLGQPLFDPDLRWVPGDVQTASFFVRNQTADSGRLSLRADARDRQSLMGESDLRLEARVAGGAWRPLPSDGAFHDLAQSLGAGSAAQVEVHAVLGRPSPNRSQLESVDVRFRVLLEQVAAGSRGPRGPGIPALAFTGTPVVALLALAALLIVIGCVLVLGTRRRKEQPHG